MQIITTLKEIDWKARTEKPEGTEVRRIDNRRSRAEVKRKFVLTRQWSEAVVVKDREAVSSKLTTAIGTKDIAQVGAEVAAEIERERSQTKSQTKTIREEVEVTVPAGVLLEMRVEWKSLWRIGRAHMVVNFLESMNSLYKSLPFLIDGTATLAAHLATYAFRALSDGTDREIELDLEMADGFTFDLVFISSDSTAATEIRGDQLD